MPDTRRCCYLSERHSSRTSARNEAKHDINNAEYLSWLDFFRKSEEGRIFLQLGVDIRSLGVTLFFPPSSPPPSPPPLSACPAARIHPTELKEQPCLLSSSSLFFFFFVPAYIWSSIQGRREKKRKKKEKEEKLSGFFKGIDLPFQERSFVTIFFLSIFEFQESSYAQKLMF